MNRHGSWVVRAALAVTWVTLIGTARAQAPLTISILPIGGTAVEGGSVVAIEVFVTANQAVPITGGQIDLPCNLPAIDGSSGSIAIVSGPTGGTTDPDGDGLRGPSSTGHAYLFGPGGLGPFQTASCRIALTPSIGGLPVTIPVGGTRYLGTWFYNVSSCATGEFLVNTEGNREPPMGTDTTRLRAGSDPSQVYSLEVNPTTLKVQTGRCCRGSTCLGELNEFCCLESMAGTSWDPAMVCADGCPCTSNAQCNDGQFCTVDTCLEGRCQSVADPELCDDDDSCTIDTCNESFNRCDHATLCLYGDLAGAANECLVNSEDVECCLEGFVVPDLCPGSDVYPCLGDDVVTFDDVLALLSTASGTPACPDPVNCD